MAAKRQIQSRVVETDSQVLFSRYEDGLRPVRILRSSGGKGVRPVYEVGPKEPGGEIRRFRSARSLIAHLTGHPEARHWTFDRYFRLGGSDVGTGSSRSVLDLFGVGETSVVVPNVSLVPTPAPVTVSSPGAFRLMGDVDRRLGSVRVRPAVRLGIDLEKRAHEVEKLLYAGFGKRIFSAGYDMQDVLQEVFRGIMARNQGTCPFDPTKSSFGHYVHLVCSCVLSNFHRKQSRTRMVEQIGVRGYQADGEWGDGDASSAGVTVECSEWAAQEMDEALRDLTVFLEQSPRGETSDGRAAVRALPLLRQGYDRQEISMMLGLSRAQTSRAVALAREVTLEWHRSR